MTAPSTGRIKHVRPRAILAATLAISVAGCASDRPYNGPQFPFLSQYTQARDAAPVLVSHSEWWEQLDDPTLNRLIMLSLRDSVTLAIARERITEARANRETVPTPGSFTSSANLGLAGTDDTGPDARGSVDLGLNWLFDPYGLRREQLRAAEAQVDIADAQADAAQLVLLLNVSQAYVELRYQQRLLTLRTQELRRAEQTLSMTRTMLDAQSATILDLTRARARISEVQSQIPGVRAAIAAKLNEIAVLAGYQPGALPQDLMAALSHPIGQPAPTMSPDVGIPTDLLRNRPDIRVAERGYYAAVAEIGIAEASQYPTLSLTGAITLNAVGSSRGADYFFGPAIRFPSLPLAATRAAIEARHSQAQQAHDLWKSTVLTAILEVENALINYRATTASTQTAHEAAQLYRRALALTSELLANDEATLTDLINAEQAVASADQAVADLLFQQGLSFVALNIRLGAGHAVGDPVAQGATGG